MIMIMANWFRPNITAHMFWIYMEDGNQKIVMRNPKSRNLNKQMEIFDANISPNLSTAQIPKTFVGVLI